MEPMPPTATLNTAPLQPEHFFNRELSWLRFNERVLEEAQNARHPLLERLKFVAIFSSNLDEFYQIRVAGLKEQLMAEITETGPDGLTPAQQLSQIAQLVHALVDAQSQVFEQDIRTGLADHGVRICHFGALAEGQQQELAAYFREKVFPVLTPLAIDPAHPVPKLRGLSLNLLVTLRGDTNHVKGDDEDYQHKVAVVPVPSGLPRFVSSHYTEAGQKRYDFVPLEEVIRHHIGLLFPNMEVLGISQFRVTRNADLDISESEAEDLLKLIERELRKRRLGSIIRMEVAASMSLPDRSFLQKAFGLETEDIYSIPGLMGLESLWQIYGTVALPELKDEAFTPAPHPVIARHENIFDAIRQTDILLHHPYDSFFPVEELIRQASVDPQVLAIKMTLYRTTGRSAIANALKEAALEGKQVTALVELKARFDEENNINWAREFERAGVNVAYGIMGLKTHCKMALVLRQEEDAIRYYVHLGTGNYNERTALIYTDISLMSCHPGLGQDVSEVFNLLTGYSRQESWRHLLVAPISMRPGLVQHILACADYTRTRAEGQPPAQIRLMLNSLVDEEMIAALYQASQAGVQVQAIIRGICCLVPGVPGLSENITVRSVVGRFLEHMRVYSFQYGAQTHTYCGSADWMPRNLSRRVEVGFPVLSASLSQQLHHILGTLFNDHAQARQLTPQGTYSAVNPSANGSAPFSAQAYFLEQARQRARHVNTIPDAGN